MSVSQSPTGTFVQIQRQMSISMDRLCKNLQLAWPFTEKFLDVYGGEKNSPKDFINVKVCTWVLFEI